MHMHFHTRHERMNGWMAPTRNLINSSVSDVPQERLANHTPTATVWLACYAAVLLEFLVVHAGGIATLQQGGVSANGWTLDSPTSLDCVEIHLGVRPPA